MTVEESLKHLRIGAWAAQCCEYDLGQIDSEELLEDASDTAGVSGRRKKLRWRI